MKNYLLFIVIFLSLTMLKYSKAEEVDKESMLKAVISGIDANYAPIKKAHIVVERMGDMNIKGIDLQEKLDIFILGDSYRVDTITSGETYSTRFYEGKWWRPATTKSGERITISARGERGFVRYDPRENFMIDSDEKLTEYLNRVAMKSCKIIKNEQDELIEMSFFEISEYLSKDGKKETAHKEKIFLFDPSKNFLPVHETQMYNGKRTFEVEYRYSYHDNLNLWFLMESRQTIDDIGVDVHKVIQTDFDPNIDISLFEFPKKIPDGTFVDDHINGSYMAGLEDSSHLSTKRGNFPKTIFIVVGLILITIGGYYEFKKWQSKHKK